MCVSASGEIHTKQAGAVTNMLLPQKNTSARPVQTDAAAVRSQNLRRAAHNESCLPDACDVSLCRQKTPGLLSKHLSICYLICVLAAGSVLDPELRTPITWQPSFTLQQEVCAGPGTRRTRNGWHGGAVKRAAHRAGKPWGLL